MTENELIEALQRALEDADNPEGAVTTNELAKAMDTSVYLVKKRLRAVAEEGRLEVVKKKIQTPLSPHPTTVAAYRIKGAA